MGPCRRIVRRPPSRNEVHVVTEVFLSTVVMLGNCGPDDGCSD